MKFKSVICVRQGTSLDRFPCSEDEDLVIEPCLQL